MALALPGMASARDLTRAEATAEIVDHFELEAKKAAFIADCDANIEFCIFAFAARTNYEDLSLEPLILYPDVFPAHPYYEKINFATKLGLVNGYLDHQKTPFLPQRKMTQIEALKVIMGAAELLEWKEKFEVEEEINGYMKTVSEHGLSMLLNPEMWWKMRYLHYALQHNIISSAEQFEPDSVLTEQVLMQLLANTSDQKADTSGDTEIQTDSLASPEIGTE